MKTLSLVSTIVLLMYGSISYSQQNSAAISFKKTVYDFGSVKEDNGTVSVDFEFTNTGKSPLIIQRVITSCDCAVADWPKEPLVPGTSRNIKVIFNPKSRVGKFDKLITVYSNAVTPSVTLQISGFVLERTKTLEEIYAISVGDFRFKNTHAAFGRILNNQIKVDTIEFINFGKEPSKIGCKIEGLRYLTVKFIPETLKPQEKGLMLVSYDAKSRNDWGFVIDRFTLTQNDKDLNGSLITVSASIEENFTQLTDAQRANAPKIDLPEPNYDFGSADEGQLIEKEFTFTNTGKEDLIIRKIKASCGCTTVEPADKVIKPGKTSSFKASIRTNGFSGRIAKSVSIITNDPQNSTVVVRITGTINGPQK